MAQETNIQGRALSSYTQDKIMKLVHNIQQKQQEYTEFVDKLTAIDISYAAQTLKISGTDTCTTGERDAVKVPVVASEVDTIASGLIDKFVNQDPLFGVLSDEGNPEAALQFQALIARDARQMQWGRQLCRFCSGAARYNVQGLEVDRVWQRDIVMATDETTADPTFNPTINPITELKAMDMYNMLFDYRYAPGDIARKGDYIGYNELISRMELKDLGNALSEKETVYNSTKAYESSFSGSDEYWNERPDITDIAPIGMDKQDTWLNWLGIIDNERALKMRSDTYMLTKLYVRIIPSELGLGTSARPTILKLRIVNNKYIFSLSEIITPLGLFPILLSDIREDGFGFSTPSVAENTKPYQDIATELLDTRLEGTKRAIGDRALYDPVYIDSQDVNSTSSTAKIPVKLKGRNSGDRPPFNQLYYPIPFEGSTTSEALRDLNTILAIKDDVNGNNFAQRGEQRPGNRTLGEFDTLNSAGAAKATPYAIRVEEQVMMPVKLMVKINILSSPSKTETVFDAISKKQIDVNIAELRQSMLEFRVTGGTNSKSALRDPSTLSTAIQFIQNSEELNATYDVPGIFAEMLAVVDIDISKYKRAQSNGGINPGNPAASVPTGTTEPGGEGAA